MESRLKMLEDLNAGLRAENASLSSYHRPADDTGTTLQKLEQLKTWQGKMIGQDTSECLKFIQFIVDLQTIFMAKAMTKLILMSEEISLQNRSVDKCKIINFSIPFSPSFIRLKGLYLSKAYWLGTSILVMIQIAIVYNVPWLICKR